MIIDSTFATVFCRLGPNQPNVFRITIYSCITFFIYIYLIPFYVNDNNNNSNILGKSQCLCIYKKKNVSEAFTIG